VQITEGTRLGRYEIAAPLASGGMGEVYRARDTQLARDVAIKVLPPRFAHDEEQRRRFEVEYTAASKLNHPNILAIHDVGMCGERKETLYVVSELLEGQTLRERLEDGALSVHRALDYGAQIARGLAAAHERGVVHRDLKPANLFVTRDGLVKILDFGLAKLAQEGDPLSPDEDDGAAQPTVTRGTTPGSVLGTVGYMAPEQVRGQTSDHRADIFSFGAVLYEMLTGRRAFRGDSAVETMSAILKEEPPEIGNSGRHVPPALARLVTHCLEKRAEDRFQSARDLVFDLESVSGLTTSGSSTPPVLGDERRAVRRVLLPAAVVATVLGVAAASYYVGRGDATAPPTYRQVTYRRGAITSARFAPDGATLVYSARWDEGPEEVYSARLDTPDARAMGMKEARLVAVTRTGEMAVLYRAAGMGRTLARVPITGGPYRDVATGVGDADWARDGSDFAVTRFGNGFRLEYPLGQTLVDSSGPIGSPRISPDRTRVAFIEHPFLQDDRGSVAVVDRDGRRTVLSEGWASVDGLAWSPDGREVWFTATRQGAQSRLHAVDLGGSLRTIAAAPGRLVLQDTTSDGRVLITHELKRGEVFGRAPGETEERSLSWHDFSFVADISPDGSTILFSESGEAGGPGYGVYLRPTDGGPAVRLGEGRPLALAPDGQWALTMPLDTPGRLVLLPTGAGNPRTLSLAPLVRSQFATWFPDGRRLLLFASATAPRDKAADPEPGEFQMFVLDVDGGIPPRPVTPPGVVVVGNMISPDGRTILAFDLHDNPPTPALYPVEGGEPRPMTHLGPRDNVLGWTTDGAALLVSAPGTPRRIDRVEIESGRRRTLYEIRPKDPAGAGEVTNIHVSADGQAYAYNLLRNLGTLFVVEGLR